MYTPPKKRKSGYAAGSSIRGEIQIGLPRETGREMRTGMIFPE